MTLKMVLAQKSQMGVITIDESLTVLQATQKMCEKHVGALLVYSAVGEPVGIITERDVLHFCAQNAGHLDKTKVREVMTKDLIIGTLESTVDEAMSIVTERKMRHLPVLSNGKVVGMVSIGDLVKAKLQQTAVEVKHLRDYIAA